ncbi:MAG: hypothetical protein WCF78_03965 [archaeon]
MPKPKIDVSAERLRREVKKGGFKIFTLSKKEKIKIAVERRKKELSIPTFIDKQKMILSSHQKYLFQLDELYNKRYVIPIGVYEKLSPIKRQVLDDYLSYLKKIREKSSLMQSLLTKIKAEKIGNREKLIIEYLELEKEFTENMKTLSDVWHNYKMHSAGL